MIALSKFISSGSHLIQALDSLAISKRGKRCVQAAIEHLQTFDSLSI